MRTLPPLDRACWLCVLCLAALFGPAAAAGAEQPRDPAQAMLAEMTGLFAPLGSRAPGMPGNKSLEEHVARLFKESGFASGEMQFPAPVFVPGEAAVVLGYDTIPIRAMHPTLMRPGNFAEGRFNTRLVYLGRGTHADLEAVKGVDLEGAVALVEFDCGDRWLNLLRFGIKGVIFLGADHYEYLDSSSKIYNTEVAVPRFFAAPADGAMLKAACISGPADVVIESTPSRWKADTLRNLWVLVPGSDPELGQEVVVFTAALDANSVVPECAFGAQSAGNLFLLLKLLDAFKAERPQRSVMLVAVNAHTDNFLGERLLAWHLLADRKDVEEVRYAVAGEMRKMQLYTQKYGLLKLEQIKIDEAELHVWMEVLWQLDARQQAQREAEHEEGGKNASAEVPSRQANAVNGEQSEPPKPEIDPVLDLSPFTEADYRAAIDAAVRKLEKEQAGFFFRITADQETAQSLQMDVERTRALQSLSFAEMKDHARRAKTVFDDEKLLESWRAKLDESTGVRLPIKGELQNEAKRSLNKLKLSMVEISSNKAMDQSERETLLADLRLRQGDMTKVLALFNKIDIGIGRNRVRYRQIAANNAQREILKAYRDGLLQALSGRHRALKQALEQDCSNDSMQDGLAGRSVALVISLDLNWGAGRFGLCSADAYVLDAWHLEFDKVAAAAAKQVHEGDRQASPFVDALPSGERTSKYFFNSTDSPAVFFHAAGGTPAVSVKSVFSNHGLTFSPGDTFDRLDANRGFRLHTWLIRYLRTLLADERITSAKVLGRPSAAGPLWSTVLKTFTLDQFSGKTTPDQPISACLITLYSMEGLEILPPLVDGDVVNCYRRLSDETGSAVLYGIREKTDLASIAYQMDSDFKTVLYDIDKGQVQESMQLNSNVRRGASRTLPMFPCTEFPVYDRVDPTLVSESAILVQQFWPISAEMKSAPQKYGTHGVACLSTAVSHLSKGPASVTIWRKEKEFQPERLLLLTSSKRCVLNATEKDPEGYGFASAQELGPDFFAWAAPDMDRMSRKRLAEMKGVSNELVTDFLARGKRALAEMYAAKEEHDHNAFVLANYKALGTEVKAYQEVRSMNTDMLKAIVLYMALMVPFCFFLERLLFSFTRLEFSMLAFVLMFTATYFVFRFIHPAFRLAMNPEAIFIAFVLGALGCFVIWVLHKRFETEMHLLFRNTAGMESDVAYATVGQTAMIIGVNNMKRRRIRTSLTTATIIMVVFTMLAFSSVSKKMQPTMINEAAESPYTGLFYHWPAGRPMDEETVRVLGNIFAGRAQMLVRRVLQPEQPMLLEKTAGPEDAIDIKAVIGLPMEEDGLLGRLPLVHGQCFSAPAAREIILSDRAFKALKLSPDEVGRATLHFLGEELTLVGVIDDEYYLSLRDLDPNLPLVPRKAGQLGISTTDQNTEDISGLTVDTAALAFLPSELAGILGASPFTVSVRLPESAAADPTALWKEVSLLLDIGNARFHVGSKQEFKLNPEVRQTIRPGVYYIGSSYRTSIGGLSRLLIPLLIAGSIILNTMLGTVYERKQEIAVYNAVGLNPTHIFLFFLAEAFVYGVIGAVGGYLIGQVLAMALKALNVVEGVNINFSSLMVGYAILFTIGLVLLSTIYPGIVATRTAVPSGKRKWSMPVPRGSRMEVDFPFIYQPHLVIGVMYYLYEYFSAFTEESTLKETGSSADSAGRATYHLTYEVALAPFDLGVAQTVSFVSHFDGVVDSYRVHLSITRISGQDANWVSANKPFLERFRKLLIRWRNFDRAQHNWYFEQGQQLFKTGGGPGGNRHAENAC